MRSPSGSSVDAEVIPVRHVDDVLVRTILALHDAHDVGRALVPNRVPDAARRGDAERHRLEAALHGGRLQRVEVLAGELHELARAFLGDPALERRAAGIAVLAIEVELRARPAVPDDAPVIGRRRRVVDDDRRRRALARGLLELVGPAAVVGHRLAAEQRLVAGDEARVVDQDQRRLAVHVDAGVVVPAVFGRVDAVADEHDLAARDRRRGCTRREPITMSSP